MSGTPEGGEKQRWWVVERDPDDERWIEVTHLPCGTSERVGTGSQAERWKRSHVCVTAIAWEQVFRCPECDEPVTAITREALEVPAVESDGMITEAGMQSYQTSTPGPQHYEPCGHLVSR